MEGDIKHSRVNEIDFLRFTAVMMVILFHYGFRAYAADNYIKMEYSLIAPIARYGRFGVELFFIISGFVILMTADRGGFGKFVVSRASRLYPAFWVCCTLTFLVKLFFGGERFPTNIMQYLKNMTMFGNRLNSSAMDGVYWSLYYEINFYIIISIILLFGMISKVNWFLWVWIVVTVAANYFKIGIMRDNLVTQYSAYFIAGASYFLIWKKGVTLERCAMIGICWVYALMLLEPEVAFFNIHYHTDTNIWVTKALISSYFIAMMAITLRKTGSFGQINWVLLGGVTYPAYLLHQYIGYIIINWLYPTLNAHVVFWGTVAFILLVSFAIHQFIEKPSSRWMKRVLTMLLERVGALWRSSKERVASTFSQ